jgi:hypothetical protein
MHGEGLGVRSLGSRDVDVDGAITLPSPFMERGWGEVAWQPRRRRRQRSHDAPLSIHGEGLGVRSLGSRDVDDDNGAMTLPSPSMERGWG